MNILIPHTWLLEHLESKVTPSTFAELVSLSGPSVERIYDREGDQVYDIEVTTNRVDSMSIRGIAREAATILNQAGISSSLKKLELPKIKKPSTQLPLPKITDKTTATRRILCVVLDTVKKTPTPNWMGDRLTQIEQNIHHSMIDITNYVTHELGHPCHAFDYKKIMELGGEIIITEAKPGQVFQTLDGETYTTVGGEIVYQNPAGEIIDLPAIKGTSNTAVDDDTTQILFWIESIQADKVRFASMTHAIRTVAAQLNEKNVDPELAKPTLQLGVKLFQDLCNAQVASDLYDHYPQQPKLSQVTVPLKMITRYLGVELETSTIIQILENLECQVQLKKEQLTVIAPSFRPDLEIPADIVEEIARMYGYHNLPSAIMDGPIPLIPQANTNFKLEHQTQELLATIGWQEIYTYSMISEQEATHSGYDLEKQLKLQNPLTDDKVYLRRRLWPSHQTLLKSNKVHANQVVFELAKVYQPNNHKPPIENLRLTAGCLDGLAALQTGLQALQKKFFVKNLVISPDKDVQIGFVQSGSISAQSNLTKQQVLIGWIGQTTTGFYTWSLDWVQWLQVVRSHPEYQPLPSTAEIKEDLTFTLPVQTHVGVVISHIKAFDDLIQDAQLSDVYQQNYTFSLTYHHPDTNLSSQDIESVRKKLVVNLKTTFAAELVGEV